MPNAVPFKRLLRAPLTDKSSDKEWVEWAQQVQRYIEQSESMYITPATATYTARATDFTINCTSGTFSVPLPTAVGIDGRIYVLKNSGAGTIAWDAAGTETIDGAPTLAAAAGVAYWIQSDGANWIIIGHKA